MSDSRFKSGFVNIIGPPNAGKSTLLNALVQGKLSIINSKAQTTRHRIKGIINTEEYQIIISDTPGIINPDYPLQEKMMEPVFESLKDADVVLLMFSALAKLNLESKVFDSLKKADYPVLVLLNKIDRLSQTELNEKIEELHTAFPNFEILPISALNNFNLDFLLNKITSLLPYSPPYYPVDQWTDVSERFIVNEVVREKILSNFEKEIPYSVEVVTEVFKRTEKRIQINSDIYCERESQKAILIGHKGSALQKVGSQARKDLEEFFDSKIHLELFVKVRKDWRKNEKNLKQFGY